MINNNNNNNSDSTITSDTNNNENNERLFWLFYHNKYIRNLIFYHLKTMTIYFSQDKSYIGNRIPFKYMNKLSKLVKNNQWNLLELKLNSLPDNDDQVDYQKQKENNNNNNEKEDEKKKEKKKEKEEEKEELIINRNGLISFFNNCLDLNLIELLFKKKLKIIKDIFKELDEIVEEDIHNTNTFRYLLLSSKSPYSNFIHEIKNSDNHHNTYEIQDLILYFIKNSKSNEDYEYLKNELLPLFDPKHSKYKLERVYRSIFSTTTSTTTTPSSKEQEENKNKIFKLKFLIKNFENNIANNLRSISHLDAIEFLASYLKSSLSIEEEEQYHLELLKNYLNIIFKNQDDNKNQSIEKKCFSIFLEYNNLEAIKFLLLDLNISPPFQIILDTININKYRINISNEKIIELLKLFLLNSNNNNYENFKNLSKKEYDELIKSILANKKRDEIFQITLDANIYENQKKRLINFKTFSEMNNLVDENIQFQFLNRNLVISGLTKSNNLQIVNWIKDNSNDHYNPIENFMKEPLKLYFSKYFHYDDDKHIEGLNKYSSGGGDSDIIFLELILIKILESNDFQTIKSKLNGFESNSIVITKMVSLIYNLFKIRPLLNKNLNKLWSDIQVAEWFFKMDNSNQRMIKTVYYQNLISIGLGDLNLSNDEKIKFIDDGLDVISSGCNNRSIIQDLISTVSPFVGLSSYEQAWQLFEKYEKLGEKNRQVLFIQSYFHFNVVPLCDIEILNDIFEKLKEKPILLSLVFTFMFISPFSSDHSLIANSHICCICCNEKTISQFIQPIKGIQRLINQDKLELFIQRIIEITNNIIISSGEVYRFRFLSLEALFLFCHNESVLKKLLLNDPELQKQCIQYISEPIKSYKHSFIFDFITSNLNEPEFKSIKSSINLIDLFENYIKTLPHLDNSIKTIQTLISVLLNDDKMSGDTNQIHTSFSSVALVLSKEIDQYSINLFKLLLSNQSLSIWYDFVISPLSFTPLLSSFGSSNISSSGGDGGGDSDDSLITKIFETYQNNTKQQTVTTTTDTTTDTTTTTTTTTSTTPKKSTNSKTKKYTVSKNNSNCINNSSNPFNVLNNEMNNLSLSNFGKTAVTSSPIATTLFDTSNIFNSSPFNSHKSNATTTTIPSNNTPLSNIFNTTTLSTPSQSPFKFDESLLISTTNNTSIFNTPTSSPFKTITSSPFNADSLSPTASTNIFNTPSPFKNTTSSSPFNTNNSPTTASTNIFNTPLPFKTTTSPFNNTNSSQTPVNTTTSLFSHSIPLLSSLSNDPTSIIQLPTITTTTKIEIDVLNLITEGHIYRALETIRTGNFKQFKLVWSDFKRIIKYHEHDVVEQLLPFTKNNCYRSKSYAEQVKRFDLLPTLNKKVV